MVKNLALVLIIQLAVHVLASQQTATALSIPPSGYWDGNDGWWSTFQIQVGTPGHTVRLLPGTSASAGSTTWAVIPQGCTLANPNLTDCEADRGGVFRSNWSMTWSTQGLGNGPLGALYQLATFEEGALGLTGNAYYGYDTISLGIPGSWLPTLYHQLIAGFATNSFWLGNFGLSPMTFNFTTLSDPIPSLMGTLRNKSLIPSTTWAYTAGAFYKDPPALASLTLGGYDGTRFDATSGTISYAFGADSSRDLLVRLESVTYDTAGSSPLLVGAISIFIDSLVAEIWLPMETCQAFEQQFKLTWNDTAELYLIDETVHDALIVQNPTFTFKLGVEGEGHAVDIVLPYAAFDLNVSQPLVGETTRYFPLKQAQNSTQYTLGRVFLQEAYVVADYDRRNFTVGQAAFPPTSVAPSIVTIYEPGTEPTESNGIGITTIVTIVVAIVVAIVIAIVIIIWVWRSRAGNDDKKTNNTSDDVPEIDGDQPAVREMGSHNEVKAELQGCEHFNGDHELGSSLRAVEMTAQSPAAVEVEAEPVTYRIVPATPSDARANTWRGW